MNFLELKDILQTGPIEIEFNKGAEDWESYPEAGMRATLQTIVQDEDDVVKLNLSFEKYDEFNRVLEQPNYYDKAGNPTLTAREAGFYKPTDRVYCTPTDDIETFFRILSARNQALLHEFRLTHGISYVAFLEQKILGD